MYEVSYDLNLFLSQGPTGKSGIPGNRGPEVWNISLKTVACSAGVFLRKS